MNPDRTDQYVVKIGEATEDGQRQVQVFERKMDPLADEPLEKPVIIEPDESLALGITVGSASRLEREVDVDETSVRPGGF